MIREPPPRVAILLPVLSLLVCTLGPLQAQSAFPPTRQIEALVARYDSAWNRRDTSGVSRLLAPRYQYFSSRGGLSSRAETMAFLGDSGYRLEHAERSEVAVSLSGSAAVVSSRWRGHGSYKGESFTDDQRCGQTWLGTGGAWRLVSEHCVQIVPDGAAVSRSNPLVGTWTLVLVDNVLPDSSRIHLYGPNPSGVLTFDAAGNYSLQIVSAGRPRFAANDKSRGTPAEYEAAVQGSNAHFGTYVVDEAAHTITFRIAHASFPNWEGTEQKRSFRLVGDRLTYTVPVPTTGPGAVGEVEWRRGS